MCVDTWPHQLSHFSPGRHTANEGTQCECHDLLLGCIPLFCHWLSPDDNHNNHVNKCLSSAQRKLKLKYYLLLSNRPSLLKMTAIEPE